LLRIDGVTCEYARNPVGIDVAQPRFSWTVMSDKRDVVQSAYQVEVALDVLFSELVWQSGRVESDQSVHVAYGGEPLRSRTRYHLRVRVWADREGVTAWSEPSYFEMGLLDSQEWVARWITATSIDPKPCTLLRRDFTVDHKIESARIYATAHGVYELQLDGERVGDWVLTPGWTSYANQLPYQTYDVTHRLEQGAHTLGVILGDGWYKGPLGWNGQENLYGDTRAALVQLHLQYEDGSQAVIASDGQWTASTGPILRSEIYYGETYDARLEKARWSAPGFDDGSFAAVYLVDEACTTLVAQESPPMRVIDEIQPLALLHTPAGDRVIDMGQNMVGWVRFRVQGDAGTVITLHHAEVLDHEGNFYTDNLRSARQLVTYTCKGAAEGEVFEPHFTFQGFRYVKVEGYPGELSMAAFTGRVIHSDYEQTGAFSCSDPLVNQLQHNILWGQKGNFVDVPTDCPQRDERLGWTGDAQVFVRTAVFNGRVPTFFSKWLRDLAFDQMPDGGVPHVIPNVLGAEAYGSSAWGDAAVICPWQLYLAYGDRRLLESQYESMKAWVRYIHDQGDDEWLWNTGFHFGDWLALDAKEGSYIGATPKDLIATAYYAHSTDLLAKTAAVLARTAEAELYRRWHQEICVRFGEEFVTPRGRIAAYTQTAHVLALMFDLVKGDQRKRTADTLALLIRENGYRLTTGFVGTPYLCRVLSENGHHDVACQLVRQTEYPSWLYSVQKGATTIWEHWDGIKSDGSFWSADMNSFNHYAYGSIGDWLYGVLAGLDTDPEFPGYRRIRIAPKPDAAFSFAKVGHESLYGLIGSGWSREDETGQMTISVEIPVNTVATIVLPGASGLAVWEGDVPLGEAIGIHSVTQQDGDLSLEVGSGHYVFTYLAV